MSKFASAVMTCVYIVRRFARKIKTDNLNAFAAQAAFFVFIAFFPFLMLILNLVKYIPITVDSFTSLDFDLISPTVMSLITSIIEEASTKSSGALISITTIAALWACSKAVMAIIRGLNSVYHTTEKRGYIRLRLTSVVYMIVFLVILIVTLAFIVFGNQILDLIVKNAPVMSDFAALVKELRWIIGVGLLILFFMFIYTVIPERKTKLKNELPGAIVSTLGWLGFSALFSFYIDNIANYSNVYGSLTAIVILMLWLYFCMIIVFFGAEINDIIRTHNLMQLVQVYAQERKKKRDEKRRKSSDKGE